MALPSSGAISISQIQAELGGSYSLRSLSAAAGKSTPDAMSEFYGYSNAVTVNINAFVPSIMGCYNNYTFAAATESSVPVNASVSVSIYWYGDLGGYIGGFVTIAAGYSCGSAGINTSGSVNCIGEYISNISWELAPASSGNQNYFPFNYYTDLYPC